MQKYITSILFGGLGNQMFQYAAGRALSLTYHVPFYLDVGWFVAQTQSAALRTFQLNVFPTLSRAVTGIRVAPFSLSRRIWRHFCSLFPYSVSIREPCYNYWSGFEQIHPPAILNGYWQCEKYFSRHAGQIRRDFAFPSLPEGKASLLAERIQITSHAVSVHIRRGDYVNDAKVQTFHGCMGADYYTKALHYIENHIGKTTLFLFSDDPSWVERNFDCCGHHAVIVNLSFPDAPHHDMHLMSLCRHHVIANSSFSWWGAYLRKEKGIVVAPHRWFAETSIDTSDICPSEWSRI